MPTPRNSTSMGMPMRAENLLEPMPSSSRMPVRKRMVLMLIMDLRVGRAPCWRASGP